MNLGKPARKTPWHHQRLPAIHQPLPGDLCWWEPMSSLTLWFLMGSQQNVQDPVDTGVRVCVRDQGSSQHPSCLCGPGTGTAGRGLKCPGLECHCPMVKESFHYTACWFPTKVWAFASVSKYGRMVQQLITHKASAE